MTLRVVPITEVEPVIEGGGLGALRTDKGNLPLESVDAMVSITGLVGRTVLTQGFHNPHPSALEATYIFPLPDRAAVTAMRMTADGRVVEAELKERGQARAEYDRAIAVGKRASIAEEERPDVFTMRVGNILPGERITVALTLVGPLSYEDGEATFRLPLVVAPRYIPGTPLPGSSVGDGYALDTDAVPDASRITPPVLLRGFPNPVRLSIEVEIDPAGLGLPEVRSSLHALVGEGNRLSIRPGERTNRDFVLRLAYGQADRIVHSLTMTPDGQGAEGTFRLTVLPPTTSMPPRPRDLVLLLDRSGSMTGWKMVAARRAAARIVDTLTAGDRFSVLTFDHGVEHPPNLPTGLVAATDRHRYRAVEHLARVDARGGTELLAPLREALSLLTDEEHDRVVVLVTDGQVGNEDQILASTASAMAGIRVHTVGIDQAVNAGFLGRLAAAGGGRSELVESEDRLDEAMERIHRRIGAPAVTGLRITEKGLTLVDGTVAPARLPDLFPGTPLVVTGRYRDEDGASFTVAGHTREGAAWSTTVQGVTADDSSLTAVWARAHLRDLEDRYVTSQGTELEQRITATSLRFGVLCRFSAWLAVDSRVVTEGGTVHRVTQPVETVAGSLMDWPDVEMERGITLAAASMPAPAPRLMMRQQRPSGGGRGKPMSKSGNPAGAAQQSVSLPFAPLPAAAPTAPAQPAAPTSVPGPGELRQLVQQARDEAARLRAAQGASAYERRELLADVGTRLDALVRHLSRTARMVILERMEKLVAELEADRPLRLAGDEFEALWTRALSVLDEFADEDLNVDPTTTERKEFWKKER